MIQIVVLLLLALVQGLTGFGLLALFRISLRPGLLLPLSVMLGIAIFALLPFLLQLCYIPLTATTVFSSLAIVCILLNIRLRRGIALLQQNNTSRLPLQLYEIPFLFLVALIIFVSAWRCYYFPPLPRDLTSGSEAIAEFAVREHTMINSVFSVSLESTNNPFKPPFAIGLQLIYKLAGFPFGQPWLSVLFISFIVFLYQALSDSLHRIMAGLLVLFFLAIPEMYAYTFMVLFDYSNAVFFFLSFYVLFKYFDNGHRNWLAFAGLLMGVATYIRSETLILAAMVLPLIAWHLWKQKAAVKTQLIAAALFIVPAVLLYVISIPVYINYYLPVQYHVPGLINTHLLNLSPLFTRWKEMNTQLIFSSEGIEHSGYFIFLFLFLLGVELIFTRRLTRPGRNWLYAVLVIYLGLPFMGYLLPLMDLENTTKRGLFKLFPLMLLYFGNNGLLVRLSERMGKWERKTPA